MAEDETNAAAGGGDETGPAEDPQAEQPEGEQPAAGGESEQELADQALAAAREAIASLGGGDAAAESDAAAAASSETAPGAEAAPSADVSDDPAAQAAAALEAARAAVSATQDSVGQPASGFDDDDGMASFTPPELSGATSDGESQVIDLLSDVNLDVKIELGRTRMLIEDVLRLSDGAVVELDKLAGDPVDVYVNNRHVARGEVLVLNENFCVRINEIIEHDIGQAAES